LIDYYLTSGTEFGNILKNASAMKVMQTLSTKGNNKYDVVSQCENRDGFNEKLLKLMCLNQAIGKFQSEV